MRPCVGRRDEYRWLTGDLVAEEVAVTFEHDIQPLLTRFGCNSGACHGKSRGQNGFALSLLGFDSDFDYASITREGRGRRISSSAPASSLLLEKATGRLPMEEGLVLRWAPSSSGCLSAGWKGAIPARRPTRRSWSQSWWNRRRKVLLQDNPRISRCLRENSDGSRRDVTESAAYQSNDRTIAR
ncbi:MAG: hypothetical protein Ct9H300mP1_25310 [Planctomycetaceae bacterium]|nr:MAG: hypothetical protein Ct9H300mP1_25310 [Planctomycetaceae bacterium]